MPTEKDMLEKLRTGKIVLPPLSIRLLNDGFKVGRNPSFDALVEVSWGKVAAKYAVECKSLSTPKAFRDGLNTLKMSSLPEGFAGLLFVPFLSEDQLLVLEKENISGFDLCGNGVVIAPEKFAVYRTGERNRYTASGPIKNIYRKNSSMVARSFLIRPRYRRVQEIFAEVNERNLLVKRWGKKAMGLSTVSKALKSLEEDLIVSRENAIGLLQPEKLLQKLSTNYQAPRIKNHIRLRVPEQFGPVPELLYTESLTLELPLVATGLSSIGRYAIMQRGEILSVYCPNLDPLLARIPGDQADRFPNLELIETEDETVFFDARLMEGFWWASPVQVFIELMIGDKRDQSIAEQVKSTIINSLSLERP